MKPLKFITTLIVIFTLFKAKAGGVMKGGVMDDVFTILLLIYIGIPLIIGGIVALMSKQQKPLNFFLGFIISLIILVAGTFIYTNIVRL